MNYETGFARDRDNVELVDDYGRAARRKRMIVIGAIVAVVLLVAIIGWRMMSGSGGADAAEGKGNKQAATVTVIVPGRQTVDRVVSATGNLGARREMPIGVAGEGGQISQVLVEPGTWVGAGQVLATIDRRVQSQQINSLAAQIGVSEADLRLAQANLDRGQALTARGFISKSNIDQLTATRDAARARLGVARAQLAQQQAATARLDIRAPAAGLVLERKVEPGQVVSAGSGVLFRMAKDGEMEMLARLGEGDLARMSVGVRATVTPIGSSQSFNCQIWQVAVVIDPQTRQGIARIACPYDKAIRPGGFATAKIISGSVDVPLLPDSAVLNDSKGSYVMIIGAGNKAERRDVKVGDVGDAGVTILEGLTGQERVVQNAGAFINAGEVVIPQRAKAN